MARLARARRLLARPGVSFAAVAMLACLLGLVHLAEVRDTPLHRSLSADQRIYDGWAREISGGDWAGRGKPVFYLGPLYPYFLGVVYRVAGASPLAAGVVQAILGGLTAGLLMSLARRWFGVGAGWGAGILAAAYGPFVFYQSLLLGATLIVFLSVAALWLLAGARDTDAWWRWLLAGASLGMAAGARGTALLVAASFVIWLALDAGRGAWRDALRRAGLVTAGVALLVAPLTLHNAVIGGDRVLLTANAGANLYIGNDPHTHGTYSNTAVYAGRPLGLSVAAQLESFPSIAARELGRDDLRPSEVSRFWSRKAREMIARDPGAWLRTVAKKAGYALNAYEVPNNRNYDFSKRFSLLLRGPLVGFGIVAPLGLAGMVLLAGGWRRHGLLYAFFLAQLAGLLIFFVTARYRLVLVPVLLVFAGALLARLVEALRAGERRAPAVSLAVVAVCAVVVHLPLPESSFVASHVNLGVIHRDAGDTEGALASFDEALALDPGFYYAAMLKGEVLLSAGRGDQGAAVLARAREAAARAGDRAVVARIDRALAAVARPPR